MPVSVLEQTLFFVIIIFTQLNKQRGKFHLVSSQKINLYSKTAIYVFVATPDTMVATQVNDNLVVSV